MHTRSLILSFALLLPFIILNFIVALRLEPLYAALGSMKLLTASPWLPGALLLLFPVALFVALRPVFTKCAAGYYRFYPLNILWGAIILAGTIFIWFGLGQDIIACDVLKIPNCD